MDTKTKLRSVGKRYQRLRDDLEAARADLAPLIVEAAREGIAPTEIVKLTGYTKDRIRVMCREAGIEPLPTGRRRKP